MSLCSSSSGALHRFHWGGTSQSHWKPYWERFSLLKLAPINFSGTVMTAFLSCWLWSLSRAMNIRARLFPEAGGDLMMRYCSPRFWKALSCMGRIPSSLVFWDRPLCW